MDQWRRQNVGVKWPLMVWIIHVIIFNGLIYKMMDRTNLIQINIEPSNMESATNVESGFTCPIVQQMEINKNMETWLIKIQT